MADIVLYELPTQDRELSCGYSLDLDETSGVTPEGEHYDAVQRNIRYNHVAVVHRGRAGIARLNMDGDQILDEPKGVQMTKIRIDNGLEYEAAPEVKVYAEKLNNDLQDLKAELSARTKRADEEVQAVKKKADEEAKALEKKTAEEVDKVQKQCDEKIKALTDQIEALQAEKKKVEDELLQSQEGNKAIKEEAAKQKADCDQSKKDMEVLQAKFDSAEADNKKLKEEAKAREEEYKKHFDEAIKARMKILEIAKAHKIENADEMDEKAIKIAVVKNVRGDSISLEGKSDAYIDACFDLCKAESHKQNDDGLANQRKDMGEPKAKSNMDTDELSIDEMEKKLKQDEANLYLKEVK